MPVITVPKKEFLERLGKNFTDEELEDIFFDFGLELDKVIDDDVELTKKVTGNSVAETLYKIEIAANRYDLLSLEGLVNALRSFLGVSKSPNYKIKNGKEEIIVDSSVSEVRGIVVAAVLRNIKFNQMSYNSFIELQDKLHENICRKRTLVSIGTHDIDTIKGPFTYSAQKPEDIVFQALTQTKSMNASELMTVLDNGSHLKPYLHIIRDKPLYPVLKDSKGVVLSLPPIINGEHSKITLNTKNVLIEVTAVDKTRANVVLDTMATLFSEYCSFEIEKVKIVNKSDKTEIFTPIWEERVCTISVNYINSSLGLNLSAKEIVPLLEKMCLSPSKISSDGKTIDVSIPPTRSDILSPCDVMEDVAIAYGYNSLTRVLPVTPTTGKQQPINKLGNQIRHELARCGYNEVLSMSLSSKKDNYENLNKVDDGLSVIIENPNGIDNQICKTSLLSGLLKFLHSNKGAPMPIKLFEVNDIVLKCPESDVGAINKKVLCATFTNKHGAGLEFIHGLLDKVMMALDVNPSGHKAKSHPKQREYTIVPSD